MQWASKIKVLGKATGGLVAFLSVAVLAGAGPVWAETESGGAQAPGDSLHLAAGTKIEVMVVRPVPARTTKAGDAVYGQTDYPVVVGDHVAIPAGSWVQGRIEAVQAPSRKKDQAQLDVLVTTIIYANGYVVALPEAPLGSALPPDATEMRVTIQASAANDLLLDNGAQMEMALATPITLDGEQVARAIPITKAPQPGSLKSATMCRPTAGSQGIPGTPGTPDTVIPGMPGTPDTVIPGGPGMPDTVIPGTPATPDTVIPGTPGDPGTPGTPGTVCPPPPIVLSSVPVPRSPGSGTGTNAGANPPPTPGVRTMAPH